MRKAVLLIFFIVALGRSVLAQDVTGNISGRIEDATHAVIAGVEVTIKSPALQGERTTVADDRGSYRFTLLPQGTYVVTYKLAGFDTVVRGDIEVGIGKTVTLNVVMEVSDLAETLTIYGEESDVDIESALVATNFNLDLLRDIPNQRDMWGILAETPGILVVPVDVGGNTVGTQSAYRGFGVAGQVLNTLDGVNATEGTAGAGIYMDYGALAAVQVAAAGNTAEVPVAGTAVTATIKSGSNVRHGEGYADASPPGFRGNNVSPDLKALGIAQAPGFSAHDFNGQLGGPFIADKLWYFVSVRDQYFGAPTTLYDKPASQGGTPNQVLSILLQNYTIKLNYQLTTDSTLTFSTQWGKKYQPFRGAITNSSTQPTLEATQIQNSWDQIGKVEYTRHFGRQMTLDMSINNFGYQWPARARTSNTPIQDDVTGVQSGAFSAPAFTQERRWHYNSDFNVFKGKHDLRLGYTYLWHAPRVTWYGAPGPVGSLGHLVVNTSSGVPTGFTTDGNPTWSENLLKENAIFMQDKFQVTRRLTLNFGLRYDRYHTYYGEQRFGLNGNKPCLASGPCTLGPFVIPTATPANNIATFNTFVPRLAFVFDPFGKTDTAITGSWGRFATNPGADISSLVNPVTSITTKYPWDTSYLGSNIANAVPLITPAYVSSLVVQTGGGQLTASAVDPKLKDSYTDEFTAGVEHQIISSLGAHVTFVRKIQKHSWGRYDRLHTASAFAPVSAIDPGPDALLGTSDDKTITVFDRLNPALPIDNYVTNKSIGDNYSTIEFGVTKRMRNHWQMLTGFDWTKRNVAQPFSEDPNAVLWNGANQHTMGWTAKVSLSYTLPQGWMLSGFFNGKKGEPYGRFLTLQTANLTAADPTRTVALAQGNLSILAEPTGSHYLPAVAATSVQLQKTFDVRERDKLSLTLGIFNLTNADTITNVNTSTSRITVGSGSVALFGRPQGIIGARSARFGVRYAF